MADTTNVYSPDYDNEGNPKPSIPELKDAIESARIDAERFARETSQFTDADGNIFQKGAKGWAQDAEAAKNAAEAFKDRSYERYDAYEPETQSHIDRVAGDGGVVLDPDFLNEVVKEAKARGWYPALRFYSAPTGAKFNAQNKVAKVYDVGPKGQDVPAPAASNEPTLEDWSQGNGRDVIAFEKGDELVNSDRPGGGSGSAFAGAAVTFDDNDATGLFGSKDIALSLLKRNGGRFEIQHKDSGGNRTTLTGPSYTQGKRHVYSFYYSASEDKLALRVGGTEEASQSLTNDLWGQVLNELFAGADNSVQSDDIGAAWLVDADPSGADVSGWSAFIDNYFTPDSTLAPNEIVTGQELDNFPWNAYPDDAGLDSATEAHIKRVHIDDGVVLDPFALDSMIRTLKDLGQWVGVKSCAAAPFGVKARDDGEVVRLYDPARPEGDFERTDGFSGSVQLAKKRGVWYLKGSGEATMTKTNAAMSETTDDAVAFVLYSHESSGNPNGFCSLFGRLTMSLDATRRGFRSNAEDESGTKHGKRSDRISLRTPYLFTGRANSSDGLSQGYIDGREHAYDSGFSKLATPIEEVRMGKWRGGNMKWGIVSFFKDLPDGDRKAIETELFDQGNLENTHPPDGRILDSDGSPGKQHNPTATYDASEDSTVIGVIGNSDRRRVLEYDHGQGEIVNSFVLARTGEDGADRHDGVAVLERDDGKYLAIYGLHNNEHYRRISSNAGDITSWGPESQIEDRASYTSVIQLEDENGDIYWLYRSQDQNDGTKNNRVLRKSTDGGDTFGSEIVLWNSNSRGYIQARKASASRIDYFGEAHPNGGAMVHFYYEGGSYYKSDGTLIGGQSALPLTPSDVTIVSPKTSPYNHKGQDLGYDANGNPVIAWADVSKLGGSVGGNSDQYLPQHGRVARRVNGSWKVETVAELGGLPYEGGRDSPGMTVYDGRTIFLSKVEEDGIVSIFKAKRGDGDGNWQLRCIEKGTGFIRTQNIKPFVPYNAKDDLVCIWSFGEYHVYNNYSLGVKGVGIDVNEPIATGEAEPIRTGP